MHPLLGCCIGPPSDGDRWSYRCNRSIINIAGLCVTEVSAVPRYFFTVGSPEREVLADPRGTVLPGIEAALVRAEQRIQDLRGRSGFDDPALSMRVEDEAHHTVLFLPLNPCD